MDINSLVSEPENVLALLDGELFFQFREDFNSWNGEATKKEIIPQVDEKNSDLEQMEEVTVDHSPVVEPVLVPSKIQLLLVVYLKDGGTVPEEQRVFLRKMIKATEIPGSKMKYFEMDQEAKIQQLKTEWMPNQWMIFGLGNDSFTKPVKDHIWNEGLVCPPIENIWNDIPQKQVLWKHMQAYFKLQKK